MTDWDILVAVLNFTWAFISNVLGVVGLIILGLMTAAGIYVLVEHLMRRRV